VQQLRIERIEPGEEVRGDEVEIEGRAAAGEEDRQGTVVPGGVEAGHALVKVQPGADRPVGEDEPDRDRGEEASGAADPGGGGCRRASRGRGRRLGDEDAQADADGD
jgi:hypothetical protein